MTTPSGIEVLIQWLFLFGILAVILTPAFMFRRIALRHNRKGWVYFLVGLGVGLIPLEAARWIGFLLREAAIIEQTSDHTLAMPTFCSTACSGRHNIRDMVQE